MGPINVFFFLYNIQDREDGYCGGMGRNSDLCCVNGLKTGPVDPRPRLFVGARGSVESCSYTTALSPINVTSLAACGSSSMVTSSRLRLVFRHFVNGRMGDMSSKQQLPSPEKALPGRADPIQVAGKRNAASRSELKLANVSLAKRGNFKPPWANRSESRKEVTGVDGCFGC